MLNLLNFKIRVLLVYKIHFILALILINLITPVTAQAQNPQSQRIVLPDTVRPINYKLHIKPDATNLSFTGNVAIDVEVRTTIKEITLNAVNLKLSASDLSGNKVNSVSYDTVNGTATLKLNKPATLGFYTLHIDYSGTINQTSTGLFSLDYKQDDKDMRALYTQFEPVDARQMLPSWDEPALKATFDFSATVPSNLMAISNMPISSTEDTGKGLKTVHFSRSPKMSTYLLFFGLGDFERISKMVNGIDVGVITKRGDTSKGQYALDSAAQLIPYFEDYFGIKYPLPKLDMLAAPGSSQFFGAMENWGAIFYFETALLLDPAISTDRNRRGVYTTVAHEIAHQWFGDLVTMSWWDDLWLNEGFASWMTTRVTNHFHPEWQPWLSSQNGVNRVMNQDSLNGTHPIVMPVLDAIQATQAFDGITYTKGQAVIRMLEKTAGDDAFRDGVRAYMQQYAYSNTVTDDLWSSVDSFSTVKITDIAHDFTLQAGVPLINVTQINGDWQLSQTRLSSDNSTPADRSWHVPVHTQMDSKLATLQTVSYSQPVTLQGDGIIIVNPNADGYYRVNYSSEAFASLITQFATLLADSQLNLINDSKALGFSGVAPLSQYLSIFDQMSSAMNPIVLNSLVGDLSAIDDLLKGMPQQEIFRAYTRNKLNPLLKKYDWNAKPGEDSNIASLRNNVISSLATSDDAAVLAQARVYFKEYLIDKNRLPAELKNTVLNIIAKNAPESEWQSLYELALSSSSFAEQGGFYSRLGSTHNLSLAKKAMELSIDSKTPITIRPRILSATSIEFLDETLDFVLANYEVVMSTIDKTSQGQVVPGLMSGSNEASMITRLDVYAAKYLTASSQRIVDKAKASITYNVMLREKAAPEINAWLSSKK
jgi:aminopeptidase N